MKIMYHNIRGLKSKLESLCEIVEAGKPDIVAIVETMLDNKDEIQIDGYEIFRNDRITGGGGGILVALKKDLRGITVREDEKGKQITESMWLRINNGKVDVKLGVVYNPQESKTSKMVQRAIYKEIEDEVQMAIVRKQKLILLGDMNCKVGECIKGNRKEITVGGKFMMKMMKENNLILVNSMELTNGIWTREEKGAQSIIDYIIIRRDDESDVTDMIVDEQKVLAPFRVAKDDNGIIKTIYSDHNVMMLKIKMLTEYKKVGTTELRTVMTKESYELFRNDIRTNEISNIWTREHRGDLQQTYDEWTTVVMNLKKKYECRKRNNKTIVNKYTRTLRRCIRYIKRSKKHQDIAATRIQILSEEIKNEEKVSYVRKINNIVNMLKKEGGALDQGMFWKFKKKLTPRKREEKTAMIDKHGKRVEDEDEIIEIYEDFYQNLLKTPRAENEIEKRRETEVEEVFDRIVKIAKHQACDTITNEDVKIAVKGLKRKKAADREGWVNELIIEAGEEMTISLTHMFNEIMKEMTIPKQWTEMIIKSIHKKGTKSQMENRRGLFLTNIISKVFEKVLDNITRDEINISEYQCGGQRGRGTIDNHIMLNAVVDNNSRIGKKTYMYFADAYKCFDRLWLKDCLVELWKAGMREREVNLIYEMNKTANIIIKTPVGNSKEITVTNIVRQGTVFGPKLCCIATQKINNGIEPISTVLTPELAIGAPVYVDDILGIGGKETIERTIRNTRWLEEQKKFRFNRNKSKYMVINTGKGKKQEVHERVKDGQIEEVYEYKYLGMWLTSDNKMDKLIKENKSRMLFMMKDIKVMGSESKVGKRDSEIQRLLYETTVIPMMLYNIEVVNITTEEMEELEKIQKTALTQMYEMPKSTPYWGMIIETGIWPIKYKIAYKQMMLYRNIVMSSDDRVAKQIVNQQEQYGINNSLYSRIKLSAEILKLNLTELKNGIIRKSQWKNMVKNRIQKRMNTEAKTHVETMSKLRFLKSENVVVDVKDYVKRGTIAEISKIMKVKLNMVKIDANYGKHGNCKICGKLEETTEHLLTCEIVKQNVKIPEDIQINTNNKEEAIDMEKYISISIELINTI